jgi:hypothetical protein
MSKAHMPGVWHLKQILISNGHDMARVAFRKAVIG